MMMTMHPFIIWACMLALCVAVYFTLLNTVVRGGGYHKTREDRRRDVLRFYGDALDFQ